MVQPNFSRETNSQARTRGGNIDLPPSAHRSQDWQNLLNVTAKDGGLLDMLSFYWYKYNCTTGTVLYCAVGMSYSFTRAYRSIAEHTSPEPP